MIRVAALLICLSGCRCTNRALETAQVLDPNATCVKIVSDGTKGSRDYAECKLWGQPYLCDARTCRALGPPVRIQPAPPVIPVDADK